MTKLQRGLHATIPIISLGFFCAAVMSQTGTLRAAETDKPAKNKKTTEKPKLKWNFTMKTLGGRQFWGDVSFFHEWRIQHNVLTGHYRLLDGNDYRHTYGSLTECQQKLTEIKKDRKLPPMKGKALIFVHGIIRSSKSFRKMSAELEKDGYKVFGFDYPSTRIEISDSAEYLHQVLESLEGIDEINFVVHSMGGLVVRAYLAEHNDKRIRRMVMMGVPNRGARMADHVKQVWLFQKVFGPAGQQLISDSDGLIANLPTPEFEFAILAGARGTINGYNVLVPGDDDGTVSVASTRLPGAADYISVRGLHSFLMDHSEAIDYTRRFLKKGHFRKGGERHPISKPKKEEEKQQTEKAAN